jgi:hypothetical protein
MKLAIVFNILQDHILSKTTENNIFLLSISNPASGGMKGRLGASMIG